MYPRAFFAVAVYAFPLLFVHALAGHISSAASFSDPATYTATLPCADCPAIHESLTFLPDGLYIDRLVYEGRNTTFQALGTWKKISNRSQLSLRSGNSSSDTYSIVNSRYIRKLAPQGSNIPSIYLPAFARAASPGLPSAAFSLRGEYVSRPGRFQLTECQSQVALMVSPKGDATALDRVYAAAHLSPGSALLVSLIGKIALRPDGKSALLIVGRFERSWPGKSCSDHVP